MTDSPFVDSTFAGDAAHPICCTGDVLIGDAVIFERTTFTVLSFRNAKFAGFKRVAGAVIADSYDSAKQQHIFTLALAGGGKWKIKDRNLYRNGCWRAGWADETTRTA